MRFSATLTPARTITSGRTIKIAFVDHVADASVFVAIRAGLLVVFATVRATLKRDAAVIRSATVTGVIQHVANVVALAAMFGQSIVTVRPIFQRAVLVMLAVAVRVASVFASVMAIG